MAMDIKSQEMFDAILEKDQNTLNTEEISFLVARRSYLNDEQKKRYEKLIDAQLAKNDGGEDLGDALDDMSVADLKELAKANEVDITGLRKGDDIKKALRDAGVMEA